jgi:hypothetical protein
VIYHEESQSQIVANKLPLVEIDHERIKA